MTVPWLLMTWMVTGIYDWRSTDMFLVITIWFISHSWLITWFVTRVTRPLSHIEQETVTTPSACLPPFCGFVLCDSFCVVCCILLFVLLSFFFWALYCLFFNIWLLVTHICLANSYMHRRLIWHWRILRLAINYFLYIQCI